LGYPGVAASCVRWGEPVEGPARALLELVETPESEDRGSALSEAEDFLVCFLAQGTVSSKDVKGAAMAAGITLATLRRARERLGIKSVKLGMDRGWGWTLAAKTLKQVEDAQALIEHL